MNISILVLVMAYLSELVFLATGTEQAQHWLTFTGCGLHISGPLEQHLVYGYSFPSKLAFPFYTVVSLFSEIAEESLSEIHRGAAASTGVCTG